MKKAILATLFVGCLTAYAGAANDELPTKKVRALLEQGGKHWSVSEVGLTGFDKYESPGKVIHLWPAEDRVYRVAVSDDGSGCAAITLRWQLQPGEQFPAKFPEYLTYVWGDPEKKAHGFGVTKKVDPKTRSGEINVAFDYSKKGVEKRSGQQEVVFALLHNGQSLGNFVRLKLAFPEK